MTYATGTAYQPYNALSQQGAQSLPNFTVSAFPQLLPVEQVPRRISLFWTAFWGALISLFTLNLYRFWFRTKLRKYYWSSVKLAGVPFEYVGTGYEKFRGFLIAAVVLAVFLFVTQTALAFFSLSYFDGNPVALQLSLVASAPFYFFAQYKGRAYLLSRTIWQGIRFGLKPNAWRYMGFSILTSLISVFSLGALYSVAHFMQHRFIMDRTYFGDIKLHQHGSPWALLRVWFRIYSISAITIIALVAFVILWVNYPDTESIVMPIILMLAFFAYMMWYLGPAYYRVHFFIYMVNNIQIGKKVKLQSSLTLKRIMMVWLIYALVILAVLLAIYQIFVLLSESASFIDAMTDYIPQEILDALDQVEIQHPGAKGLTITLFTLGPVLFVGSIPLMTAAHHVMLEMPLFRAYAASVLLCYPEELFLARQRAREGRLSSDGFADALDVDMGF